MSDEQALPKPWRLLSIEELRSIPPPSWLVEGILSDGLTVVYGAPKTGKSFLALDWACSIATGRSWFAKQTIQHPVVYVSGEGGGGLAQRIDAWAVDRSAKPDYLYTVNHGVKLMQPWQVDYLAEDVHAVNAGLLVVDTLARSMAGGDENSSGDMGLVISRLDQIRQEHGCGVLVVHHSGKDPTQERGSSALRAAADSDVRVESPEMSDAVSVTCEAQKDAPEFWPWRLKLVQRAESAVLSTHHGGQHARDDPEEKF